MTSTALDMDATDRTGRRTVMQYVREIADDRAHDPYGSGMHALGAIVDVLWESGEGVPSAIATPGAGGGGLDSGDGSGADLWRALFDRQFTTDDLRYGMFVVSRYIDVVRMAGRDH